MAGRAEELYSRLQDRAGVLRLIGETEDAHLDCKEWPSKEEDVQKTVAKATCGLTNADGGVLVFGMKAECPAKDEPDVVTAVAPVPDTSLVKSRVLGLISNLVEPGVVGIEAVEIADTPKGKTGFVVFYIPKSEGSPRRSRKDWKFYLRIGSATLPMEYWQIEDMFGKRPHPKLELYMEVGQIENSRNENPRRSIVFGLRNDGRGLAKFPGIRFKRSQGLIVDRYGIDGNMGFGIPLRPSEAAWLVFRGGVDDVIYPGETRQIGKAIQTGVYKNLDGRLLEGQSIWSNKGKTFYSFCKAAPFSCEISCEGTETRTVALDLPEASMEVETRHW